VSKKRKLMSLTILLGFLPFFELSCLPPGPGSVSALPEQIPIQQARVDPAFSTTEMKIIGLLPFSNARQYDDAYVLYDNLIDKFSSKHPQYKVVPPDEVLAKFSSAKLTDDFNVFLGDYTNTGVANPDFLRKIKGILDVDAVLFGDILAMGPYSYREKHVGPVTGRIWYEDVTVNRVGIRLACFRGKDGRNIWEGKHILSEKADLSSLANKLAVIFANYFGSRAY